MITLGHGNYLGNNKTAIDHDGLILSVTEYPQAVYEGWHAHDNAHLTYAISGGNREQRRKNDAIVRPGTVLFYHPQELHRNTHTSCASKNINLEITSEFLTRYGLQENQLADLTQRGASLRFSLIKMLTEPVALNGDAASSAHMLFLSEMVVNENLAEPRWVAAARDYLNDTWSAQPDLLALAAEVGVHPVTVSKHFTRYFGCTLSAYLRKLKTEHALLLIRSGRHDLTEIAYTCGFFDQSHFIRTFKEMTHLTPKAFQRI